MATFVLADHHLDLLRRLAFDWDDEIEFGSVCSDWKRPFGNSDVEGDINEILGDERCIFLFGAARPDQKAARRLVAQLAAVVNLIVFNALNDGGSIREWLGYEMPYTWRADRLTR